MSARHYRRLSNACSILYYRPKGLLFYYKTFKQNDVSFWIKTIMFDLKKNNYKSERTPIANAYAGRLWLFTSCLDENRNKSKTKNATATKIPPFDREILYLRQKIISLSLRGVARQKNRENLTLIWWWYVRVWERRRDFKANFIVYLYKTIVFVLVFRMLPKVSIV